MNVIGKKDSEWSPHINKGNRYAMLVGMFGLILSDTKIVGKYETILQFEMYIWEDDYNNGVYLLSTRSVLLPTRTIITSLPLSVRTSSIHFAVLRKDCRPNSQGL